MTETHPNASPYKDRHGRLRWRYRRRGQSYELPHAPGHPDFEAAYADARIGIREREAPASRGSRKGRARHHQRLLFDYCADAVKRASTRAKSKGLPFSLTTEFVRQMMEAQRGRCAVSGIYFIPRRHAADRALQAFRPSIDRIIPDQGYVPGNVRLVCEIVNVAMSNWGVAPLQMLVAFMRQQETMAELMAEPSGRTGLDCQ